MQKSSRSLKQRRIGPIFIASKGTEKVLICSENQTGQQMSQTKIRAEIGKSDQELQSDTSLSHEYLITDVVTSIFSGKTFSPMNEESKNHVPDNMSWRPWVRRLKCRGGKTQI
jgi:hypothetical protein